jgi:hypothetical protein
VKTHVGGAIAKHKAPSMVSGLQICEGENFSNSFAPIAKYNTVWILTTFTAHKN